MSATYLLCLDDEGFLSEEEQELLRCFRGTYERLASSWSYPDVFADPEQARAAAGMALLLGYGEGDRALTPQEQQTAREAGFGILSDAFGGPHASDIDPDRHRDLTGPVPTYGGATYEVGAGNLRDPRSRVEGVRGEVDGHRRLTRERYDPTEVDRSHDRYRGDTGTFGQNARADARAQKRDHYAQLLREQAMLPRPIPGSPPTRSADW